MFQLPKSFSPAESIVETQSAAADVSRCCLLESVSGVPRLISRFYGDQKKIEALRALIGKKVSAEEAAEAGLITAAPDDLEPARRHFMRSVGVVGVELAGTGRPSRRPAAPRRCTTNTLLYGRPILLALSFG